MPLPSARRKSSSAIAAAASGRASPRIAADIAASRGGSGLQPPTSWRSRAGVEIAVEHDDRAAGPPEVLGVQRLVVGGRVGVGNEDRRRTAGRELEDRAACARDAEVGGGEHALEVVGRRRQAVAIVGRGHPRAHLVEIARAAQVQHDPVERAVAERIGDGEVDAEGARERAERGDARTRPPAGRARGATSARSAAKKRRATGRPTTR